MSKAINMLNAVAFTIHFHNHAMKSCSRRLLTIRNCRHDGLPRGCKELLIVHGGVGHCERSCGFGSAQKFLPCIVESELTLVFLRQNDLALADGLKDLG